MQSLVVFARIHMCPSNPFFTLFQVDHTVVMYLIDPRGQFNDFYGQTKSAGDITRDILKKMNEFSK